jgi:hypothetical protein
MPAWTIGEAIILDFGSLPRNKDEHHYFPGPGKHEWFYQLSPQAESRFRYPGYEHRIYFETTIAETETLADRTVVADVLPVLRTHPTEDRDGFWNTYDVDPKEYIRWRATQTENLWSFKLVSKSVRSTPSRRRGSYERREHSHR